MHGSVSLDTGVSQSLSPLSQQPMGVFYTELKPPLTPLHVHLFSCRLVTYLPENEVSSISSWREKAPAFPHTCKKFSSSELPDCL